MTDELARTLLEQIGRLTVVIQDLREGMAREREAKGALDGMRERAAARQRRFRERHGDGNFSAELREWIYDRDGRKCLSCGATERLSIDHIVPKVRGGDDDVSNLQTLCIPCNSKKNGGDFRVTSVTSCDVTPQVVKASSSQEQDQLRKEKRSQDGVTQLTSRNVTSRPKVWETGPLWQAYSAAYSRRYGAEPVRNAKVNGQLVGVIKRLGAEEAPDVAAFYVEHKAAFYTQKGHPVGLLLLDAEKLRTEWVTGRQITSTAARQQERTAANGQVWDSLLKGEKHGVG